MKMVGQADINEPSAVNSKNGKDSGSPLDIAKRKANSVLLQRRRAAVVKVRLTISHRGLHLHAS